MKNFIFYSVLILLISCQSQRIVTSTQDAENSLKQGNYKNIKISEYTNSGACEPSIAINPTNPRNIVVGNVLKDVHVSFDGGFTWKSSKMKSNHGVYGDPCIVADFEGNFYYLHLANPDNRAYRSEHFLNTIVLHRSSNNGKSWNDGYGIGKNEPAQQDKEWAAVDPKSGSIYVTWTEFDQYGSKNPIHKSRIRFSKSEDKGKTFSEAITISDFEGNALDDDLTTEGAVPAVDLDGNIYVAWAYDDKIFFDKSEDKGKTWLERDQVIAQQVAGWNYDIPDLGRCNGMPVTQVDVSNSKNKGTIYVNWSDQRNGKDNTDIFIIKSVDQGKTWSSPIKVNQDKTQSHQFFTWMSVDPVTGYIYIVYYDRSRFANYRLKSTRSKTDVVLAVSKDGGVTFTNEIISQHPFTPNKYTFFGDYNNISAYNGVVRPIWTRYDEEGLSVWTAIINYELIIKN